MIPTSDAVCSDKYKKNKDFDAVISNSLFIFNNLYWSNMILTFKMSGYDISGGTEFKRHLLCTLAGK